MPAHVHLEEPLLGVHVALRAHQVVVGVAVELRDAVLVAQHLDRPLQPGQRRRSPVGLRERRRTRCTTVGQPGDQQDHHGQRGRRHRPGPTAATSEAAVASCVARRSWCTPLCRAVALALVTVECQRRRTVPTYQYACTECGHAFEQFQSFSDDALTAVPGVRGPAAQGVQRRRASSSRAPASTAPTAAAPALVRDRRRRRARRRSTKTRARSPRPRPATTTESTPAAASTPAPPRTDASAAPVESRTPASGGSLLASRHAPTARPRRRSPSCAGTSRRARPPRACSPRC